MELKNGKVHFKQKLISFEKQSETLQGTSILFSVLVRILAPMVDFPSEIVNFRKMLEERIERQASPLPAIPDSYKPLIVKLAHERYAYYQAH